MKAVNFYKLPRAIQDRFVGSVVSGFAPAPLLATKGATPTKLMWLGLSAACFVVTVILTRVGYGSLGSALALHSWRALILYMALVFGMAFGLVQAFGRMVRERALPYAAGVYLFPASLIDARSDQFQVFRTQDIEGVDLQGGAVRVLFVGGAQFVFACPDQARAAALVAEVKSAREQAMHAAEAEDPGAMIALDPLHNPRFSSPVGPRDPHEMRLPPWKKYGWGPALAVAAIIAPSLWAVRNSGSDTTMYARATHKNDTEAYRTYLERGEKFKELVASTLLPRAELRDAERYGTVDALLKFKADHPKSKIGAEVAISIRAAMLVGLEHAKAVGTLSALDDFEKRYPEHVVDAELRDAIHAVYARELEVYKTHAPVPPKDKAVVAFVERLFAFAEKHGPKVEVRFRHKKSETMGRADQYVAKTAAFMGEVSYPSRRFDDTRWARREAVLGKMLTTRLDMGFSPELLDVGIGAQVPPDAETLPEVRVPTLFVSYTVEWSGHSSIATRPRGIYVGMDFPFEAVFVIPGDAKPIKLKADVLRQPPLAILKDEDLQPGPAEEKVYEALATDALESLGNKVLGLFFAKEK